MFTPERALAEDRRSWATVIALAIVAETALLWLVTGRAMWRRGLVHLPALEDARFRQVSRRQRSAVEVFTAQTHFPMAPPASLVLRSLSDL